MRAFDAATTAAINAGGILAHALVWISARNRTTNAVESIGLWTGAQPQTFTIAGQARTYFGAGTLIDVPAIEYGVGTMVKTQTLRLSNIAPEVENALRAYEPRLAPVQIHRALFDPFSEALVAEPHRVFQGYVDRVVFSTPPVGGQATCDVTLVSGARDLTRTLNLMRSDDGQRTRQPGDGFLKYANLSGLRRGNWGGRTK